MDMDMNNSITQQYIDKDLVIIGGGPAGLAAAAAAKENGVDDIIILERDKYAGGVLRQCIHDGFGLKIFGERLTGPEYAARYEDKTDKLGIEIKLNTFVLNITSDRIVQALSPEGGMVFYRAKAVILAMGCRERTRASIMLPGTRPAGVYTAGLVQRLINIDGYVPGKEAVILGSGDIGLIMARRLTLEGVNVKAVYELMSYSSGLKRNIVQCLDDYGIPLYLNHTVVNIHGKNRIEGVTVAEVDDKKQPIQGTEKFVPCDLLVLSVGLIPENELSKSAGVQLNRVTGGLFVDDNMCTNKDGIFACGNVVHVHDLVDYVTLESTNAGRCAAEYIKGNKSDAETVEVIPENGIRYVVPNKVHRHMQKDTVEFMFRVGNVYRDAKIVARDGDRIIKSVKRKILTPGEMETLKLTAEEIASVQGEIHIGVEL